MASLFYRSRARSFYFIAHNFHASVITLGHRSFLFIQFEMNSSSISTLAPITVELLAFNISFSLSIYVFSTDSYRMLRCMIALYSNFIAYFSIICSRYLYTFAPLISFCSSHRRFIWLLWCFFSVAPRIHAVDALFSIPIHSFQMHSH